MDGGKGGYGPLAVGNPKQSLLDACGGAAAFEIELDGPSSPEPFEQVDRVASKVAS